MAIKNTQRSPGAWLGATVIFAVVATCAGSVHAQVIANNTPGFVKRAKDLGPADPSTLMTATVWLKLRNPQQLDRLVDEQYQPESRRYHQWVTQDQFNTQFAPSAPTVQAVENYLQAKDLAVLAVAENNFYVKVQGTVGQIEQVFKVQIHRYSLQGKTVRSNAGDPSVDGAVGAFVAAITGLDDFGFQPMLVRPTEADGTPLAAVPLGSNPAGRFFEGQCFRSVETQTFTAGTTSATYTGNRFAADITNTKLGHLPPCGYQPSELQTAYNLNPLYAAGLDGTGETIVITDAFGSATIQEDAELFSEVYGLPPINLTVLRAPGVVNNPHSVPGTWDAETTLDVEWAHAIAPGAAIVLVIGPTNQADLDEAVNYAVVHHLGNVISNSWASLEGFGNPAQLGRVERILEQAAAQGIDVNFASGDDGDEHAVAGFKTVDFPASSPFATGVGGTSLGLNADHTIAFQTGWGTNLTLVAGRLSQGAPPINPPFAEGFQLGSGGGASLTFAKPSFQNGLPGTKRLVPDVALLADPFTGVEVIETINGRPSVFVVGGTSVATPTFSGVMAIASQANGAALGQAARLLYSLPAGAVNDVVPFSSSGNVTGSITTPSGTTNFTADQLAAPLGTTAAYLSALYNSPFTTRWFVITFGTDTSLATAPGWDDVTGVGTPNGAAFVSAVTGVPVP